MSAPPPIDVCQRWTERRASYRPAREVVSTSSLDVTTVPREVAKAFVEQHHYSASFPAPAKDACFALHLRGELAGIAAFTRPFTPEVITNAFPLFERATDGVELGRVVLLDEVGANAETWFLARCFEQIRARFRGVVSFSDPHPRYTLDGDTVMPGHVGTIYQAFNARYLGISDRKTIRLLPDGTEFSNYSSGKIRRKLRGWRAAVAELEAWGAEPLAEDAPDRERIEWLERYRDVLTRPVRHPGNHRYTWLLDPVRGEITYGPERAYPKRKVA